MVQVLEQQGNIFGRLGKGVGQGLADQIPKEIERNRLSSGLRQFEQESANLTPLQQYTRLAAISGITPQMLQTLPEILKFQGERQGAINAGTPGNSQRKAQTSVKTQTKSTPKIIEQQKNMRENPVEEINRLNKLQKGLTSPESIQTALQEIREPTQKEIFSKRAEILKQNPWMSVDSATNQAQDFFKRQNAQKIAQIEQGARQEAVESKISAKQVELRNSLGTLGKDLPEETFDRAVMRQQYQVANGMTPTQAANIEKKNMMKLATAYNSLKNNIGNRPLMESASLDLRKSIKDLKQPFKDNDELPLFKNTLVNNLDIGDHLASFETWNPNKKIEKALINTSANDDPKEVAARLAKNLDNDQSLFSIGYLLNKIGQDDKAVIDELMNLSRNDLVNLNERQRREGAEYYPVEPKLEDDFFTAFGGLLIGPVLKYITGQREKVGTIEKLKRKFGGKE
jgi:hypothetical protein